jgi:hypothetical protein
MTRLTARLASLVILLPIAARGQGVVPPACKVPLDGAIKAVAVPHHAYSAITEGPSKTDSSEDIVTGGVTYVKVRGAWHRNPMTQQQQLDLAKENIQTAKVMACHELRSESVNGTPADVYSAHIENEDTKDDATIWIAKSSGLILREEVDVDTAEGGGKGHIAMRYDYANVAPPASVK